jgi:hypothetical protein
MRLIGQSLGSRRVVGSPLSASPFCGHREEELYEAIGLDKLFLQSHRGKMRELFPHQWISTFLPEIESNKKYIPSIFYTYIAR